MRARALIPFLLALVALKLALDHVGDVDLFWHIRLGLDLIEARAMRSEVAHTWTYSGAWPPFDWLSQLLVGGLFLRGGFTAIALAKAALAVGFALCLYRTALLRTAGHARASGLAILVLLFVAAGNFSTRPLFFANALFALTSLLVEEARHGRRWALWALPPLFCLWANLHGSWPIGLGPLGVLLAEQLLPVRFGIFGDGAPEALEPAAKNRLIRWIRLDEARPCRGAAVGAVFFLCALAPLVSPQPLSFLLRPFQMMGQGGDMQLIAEWAAVPWRDPSFWILLGSAGLIALGFAFGPRPRRFFETLLLLAVFGLALAKSRMLCPYAIVAAPVLAEGLSAGMSREGFRRARANLAIAGLALALLGSVAAFRMVTLDEQLSEIAPVEAVAVLEASGLGEARGFHFYDWGGYLVLKGIPSFIDGRLEPFQASGVLDEYLRIEAQADVAALEARQVAWILTRPDFPLAQALPGRAGWREIYGDGGVQLWVREAEASAGPALAEER